MFVPSVRLCAKKGVVLRQKISLAIKQYGNSVRRGGSLKDVCFTEPVAVEIEEDSGKYFIVFNTY